MSNPEDKKQEQPELKATNYEMIPTEQIPIADPNQIFLMNPELTPDSIPPAQLVAMNAAYTLQKSSQPTSLKPQQLFCPRCNEIVLTKVQKRNGDGTYLFSCMLCACGCFLGCCLIPCFIEDCRDSLHYCGKCNHEFGVFSFLTFS